MYTFVMPARPLEEVVSRILEIWPTVCERYASETGVVLSPSSDLSVDGLMPDGHLPDRIALVYIKGRKNSRPDRDGSGEFDRGQSLFLADRWGDTFFEVHFEDELSLLICLFECLRENYPWSSYEQWCLLRAVDLAYMRYVVEPAAIFSMSAESTRELPLLGPFALRASKLHTMERIWEDITESTDGAFTTFDGYKYQESGYDGFLCDDSPAVWVYSDRTFFFGEIHCDVWCDLRRVTAWLLVEIEDHYEEGPFRTEVRVRGDWRKAAPEMDLILNTVLHDSSLGLQQGFGVIAEDAVPRQLYKQLEVSRLSISSSEPQPIAAGDALASIKDEIDREIVRRWREDQTYGQIAREMKYDLQHVKNKVTTLRKAHGEQVVPYHGRGRRARKARSEN